MEERQEARAARQPAGAPSWFWEPTFGQRILAAFLDGFLFLGLAFVVLRLPFGLGAQRVFMIVASAAYLILATALTGQTLGKRVLGIRVVDVETGTLPGLRAAVIRWAVPAAPALVGWVSPTVASYVSWFSFAVFMPILKGPQHRGLHDLIAGTIVTRVGA